MYEEKQFPKSSAGSKQSKTKNFFSKKEPSVQDERNVRG